MKMKKEKEKTKMFKAILTYVAVKNVIIFVVLAAMMLGMLAVAAAFWFLVPAAG